MASSPIAASASTNIALEHLKEDRLEDARAGLEESLRFLAREAFPDTEIRTRLGLVHVRNALQEPPRPLLEEIVALLDKFGGALQPDHRQICHETVEEPLRRYTAQALSPADRAWVAALARRLQTL